MRWVEVGKVGQEGWDRERTGLGRVEWGVRMVLGAVLST